MSSREEEDAWRQIVDNYGERPQLTDEPPEAPPRPMWTSYDEPRHVTPLNPATPVPPVPAVPPVPPGPPGPPEDEEERFVPPDPPPVPRPRGQRLMAWLGVLGVPVLLVVTMLAAISLPPTVTTVLVVWFLGGFLYLVSQMPRQRDDPWDDGAVL